METKASDRGSSAKEGARSSGDKNEEKQSLAQALNDFLRTNRILVLVIAGVIVAGIVGLSAWSGINEAILKASTAGIEKAEADYEKLSAETDTEKKTEAEKKLVDELNTVAEKWPRRYAGQRAQAILAELAEKNKDWQSAETHWLKASMRVSYLSPVALERAAVAAEERMAPDKAFEYYKRFVDEYPNEPGAARALFSLGRLSEGEKKYQEAQAHYERIVSAYADQDWTKLAKDRIIFLKANGLIK